MIHIFIDGGFFNRNYPSFFSKGGKLSTLKANIENSLNTDSKVFYYFPPPYVHNPRTLTDSYLQKRYYKLKNALQKEKDVFFISDGKTLELQCDNCGHKFYKQKEVDVQIAIDMLEMYYDSENQMRSLCLIAGDQDFCPAISLLKNKGVKILIPTGENVARKLLYLSDTENFDLKPLLGITLP